MSPSPSDSHTLVVGGTGMLRGLCLELARRGDQVAVVARSGPSLRELERAARAQGGKLFPLPVDYTDTAAFERALSSEVEARGRFDFAVLWVHPEGREVPEVVARFVHGSERPSDILTVLGSAGPNLAPPRRTHDHRTPHLHRVRWREVVLGFVLTEAGSRWLSNDEISSGVLEALDSGTDRSVVGVLEPWSERPGA